MRSADRHPSDRQLVAKVDRELKGVRAAAVEAHLAACDACRAREARLRAAALAVRMAVRSPIDGTRQLAGRDRLARAMEGEGGRIARRSGWRPFGVLTPLTATAAVVIGALILANPPQRGVIDAEVREEARMLPIARVTPGAVSSLTATELCAGHEPSRMVAPAVARQVLREYGMQDVAAEEYELDALITPELGGTVAPENLWPQRYTGGIWTAYVKDDIEVHLRDLVCAGEIELAAAQREIATDWVAAYKRHFRRDRPATIVRAEIEAPELIIATHDADRTPRFLLRLAAEQARFQ